MALKGPTDRVSLEAPQIMVDNAFYGGELSSFFQELAKITEDQVIFRLCGWSKVRIYATT